MGRRHTAASKIKTRSGERKVGRLFCSPDARRDRDEHSKAGGVWEPRRTAAVAARNNEGRSGRAVRGLGRRPARGPRGGLARGAVGRPPRGAGLAGAEKVGVRLVFLQRGGRGANEKAAKSWPGESLTVPARASGSFSRTRTHSHTHTPHTRVCAMLLAK